jgi:peptidoglycan hydrolase-like protein with peptidoglycan-binding domain
LRLLLNKGLMSLAASWKRDVLVLGCTLLLAASLSYAQSPTPVSQKSKNKSSAPKSSTPKSSSAKNTQHSSGQKSIHKSRGKGKRSKKSASWRKGQQKIDGERARSIQEALIREHYLDGEPTGVWDQKSQKAMEKFQADNGWQSKMVPDSRALIKLGLGPNHDHLLNPDSAMTSPIESRSTMADPSPGPSADPAGNSSQPQP